jgi:hypothetical protein
MDDNESNDEMTKNSNINSEIWNASAFIERLLISSFLSRVESSKLPRPSRAHP